MPDGAADSGEIGIVLDRLPALRDRLDAAIGADAVLGSLAALDHEWPNARFVGIHAAQALSTALDHLTAWRLLIVGRTLPVWAHMTLLRTALEGAVRCRWLVDPGAESATRVARGYATQRDDYLERERFERAGSAPTQREGKSATNRLAELETWRAAANVAAAKFESTTALMTRFGHERWFRLASAVAHGKEWALVASDITPAARANPRPGVGHGIVTARDEVSLALTRVAVAEAETALGELEAYVLGQGSG